MTLNHLFREYTCVAFDIIDILGIVGQQLSLVLKQSDKSMRRRPFLFRGKDILRDREENARVFPENLNIKDFLRIAETQMFELRV